MVRNKEAVPFKEKGELSRWPQKYLYHWNTGNSLNNPLSHWQFQIDFNIYEDFTTYFHQSISEERGRIHLGNELWHG